MTKREIVSGSLLALAVIGCGAACLVTAEEKAKPQGSRRIERRAIAPKLAQSGFAATEAAPVAAEIRALAEAIMLAYRHHQAQEFASVFTADGEYLDDRETLLHGRSAIEQEFTTFFQANPHATIEIAIDAVRPIASNVVKVQGTTSFRREPDAQPSTGRCSLICVNDQAGWKVASLREMEPNGAPNHHEQIKPLEWLVGDWISEGSQSDIHFSCRWDQDGNYLLRDFSIQTAGGKTLSGTQRIGYDSLSDQLKIWVFDSQGGYSQGYVTRHGEGWMIHTAGVTAAGQIASGNEILTPLDAYRIEWESVDRLVAGNRIPDSGKITLVRKPPAPAAAAAASNPKSPPR